jgi:hypothetical protein
MLVPEGLVEGGITEVKLRPEQGRSFFVLSRPQKWEGYR